MPGSGLCASILLHAFLVPRVLQNAGQCSLFFVFLAVVMSKEKLYTEIEEETILKKEGSERERG